jgi:hypothetical protein
MEWKAGKSWWLLVPTIAALISGSVPAVTLDEGASQPRPVHRDPDLLVDAALETTRAFLMEDTRAARRSLDALKEATPPLHRERDAVYGSEILSFDQAFHVTIDRAREYSTAGRLEDAFNQYVWVQRACVTCHGLARTQGFLPRDPSAEQPPTDPPAELN